MRNNEIYKDILKCPCTIVRQCGHLWFLSRLVRIEQGVWPHWVSAVSRSYLQQIWHVAILSSVELLSGSGEDRSMDGSYLQFCTRLRYFYFNVIHVQPDKNYTLDWEGESKLGFQSSRRDISIRDWSVDIAYHWKSLHRFTYRSMKINGAIFRI